MSHQRAVDALLLLLIAGGVGLCVSWGMLRLQHEEVQGWPMAPGQITQSTGGSLEQRDGKAKSYLSLARYRYSVAGRSYRGKFVTLAAAADKDFVRRHPVGRVVRVRYNPQRPSVSYLDTRFHFVWQLRLYFGLGVILLALVLRFVYRRQQLRARLRLRAGDLVDVRSVRPRAQSARPARGGASPRGGKPELRPLEERDAARPVDPDLPVPRRRTL